MTFMPSANSPRPGALPAVTRRTFRSVLIVLALASAPTLAHASSPDNELAQMRAECAKLHEEMKSTAKDASDPMNDSSLSDEQRRTHLMCMSMPHDSGGEGQVEKRL